MYLIVVGAGPEGSSLIDLALKDGHEVALIETNEERARKVVQNYNVNVFQADIAEGGILEEAQANRADGIIATTRDDTANLMAMFLGKEHGIKSLVSLVNEPQHQKLFQRLGVRIFTDPEVVIAKHLYHLVAAPDSE